MENNSAKPEVSASVTGIASSVEANARGQSTPLSHNGSQVYIRWAKSFPTMMTAPTIEYSCAWCKKAFDRKCDRNRHHKKHTRPYKCTECGKGFVSRKDRDRHSNIWLHGQQMNYLCTMPGCLSSTTKDDGLYAFGRVDRWRTHMIKVHGLSKTEVRSIVKSGIPMENKSPEQIKRKETGEVWGVNRDVQDLEQLEQNHLWNDMLYEDDNES